LITKQAFLEVGGFNRTLFSRLCEDVDLGVRLDKRNYRIMMEKSMQVTHLKKYTLWSLAYNEAIKRAIPWTHILLFHRMINFNLCTKISDLASLVACNLTILLLMAMMLNPPGALWALLLGLSLITTAVFMIGNWRLFGLFYRVYGGRFLLQGIAVRHAYYTLSAVGSLLGLLTYPFVKPEEGLASPCPGRAWRFTPRNNHEPQ
jgi:hypothetical protein